MERMRTVDRESERMEGEDDMESTETDMDTD